MGNEWQQLIELQLRSLRQSHQRGSVDSPLDTLLSVSQNSSEAPRKSRAESCSVAVGVGVGPSEGTAVRTVRGLWLLSSSVCLC